MLKANDYTNNETNQIFNLFAHAGTLLKNKSSKAINDDIDSLLNQLQQTQAPYGLQAEIDLLIARLLYFQGKYEEARSLIAQVVDQYSIIMPDWLMLDYACAGKLNLPLDEKNNIALEMAKPIPWSAMGSHADIILFTREGIPLLMNNTISIELPTLLIGGWFDIAELYAKEKLIHSASEKYICAIYSLYALPLTIKSRYVQWSQVAILEKQQQHPRLAFLATLRAIIIRPEKLNEIKQVWQQEVPAIIKPAEQKISAKTAETIAAIYSRGKFYSLAIEVLLQSKMPNQELIRENRNKLLQQIQRIQKKWPTCYMSGQDISLFTDGDELHIPMPSETFWNEDTLYTSNQ